MDTRRIEKALAAAGVPEGRDPRYATTARMLYAALALRSGEGLDEGVETLVLAHADTARMFVAGAWRALDAGAGAFPVARRHHADVNSNGGLTMRLHAAFISGSDTSPSTSGVMPVRQVKASDLELATTRRSEMHEAVMRTARPMFPDHVGLRLTGTPATRWGHVMLYAKLEGVEFPLESWEVRELAHRDTTAMTSRLRRLEGRFEQATSRLAALRSARPEIDEALTRATGDLPVVAKLVPRLSAQEGGIWDEASIALDGYSASGLAATIHVCEIGRHEFDKASAKLDREIAVQRERRRAYGPRPLDEPGEWRVDVVVHRLLERENRLDALRVTLERGHATTAGGIELRVGRPGVIQGEARLSPDVAWRDDELRIVGRSLPQAMATGLVGAPIGRLVDSELLRDAGVIRSIRQDTLKGRPRLRVRLDAMMEPVTTAA